LITQCHIAAFLLEIPPLRRELLCCVYFLSIPKAMIFFLDTNSSNCCFNFPYLLRPIHVCWHVFCYLPIGMCFVTYPLACVLWPTHLHVFCYLPIGMCFCWHTKDERRLDDAFVGLNWPTKARILCLDSFIEYSSLRDFYRPPR
jgi:hypothetical protein